MKNENEVRIGENFLANNESLGDINLPKIERIGENFLANNVRLEALGFIKGMNKSAEKVLTCYNSRETLQLWLREAEAWYSAVLESHDSENENSALLDELRILNENIEKVKVKLAEYNLDNQENQSKIR